MAEFTFGPFRFDAAAVRLSRDNAEVRLRPQALQVLRVLLQHGGRPIGYDRMIAEAWHGTFVSRHTVDVTVGEVKKVLGEYGRWIIHRPKVGYSLEVPTSDELVRKGWHFASRRTREGAERAIECFQQAATAVPGRLPRVRGAVDVLSDAGDVRNLCPDRGLPAIPRGAQSRRRPGRR